LAAYSLAPGIENAKGRFHPIMPAIIRDVISKFTFNGWALEGYLNVLWYADPSASLGALLVSLTMPVLGRAVRWGPISG